MPLRAKNGKWEYRFKLNGERVSKLTDLAATDENRMRAERLEKQHRDRILKGEETAKRQPKRGFTEASEEFMDHVRIEHQGKPNTIRRVETSLASLRVWFGNKHVSAIRQSDVRRYGTWRQTGEEGIAPVQPITLRHDLDNLSKFYVWAISMDLAQSNPVAGIKKPSADDAIRMHILTAAEEFEYFHRCEEDGQQDLADLARIMLDQGMRPDEVLSLEQRGCRDGSVTVFAGKTKAARRTLPLSPQCRLIVERRLAQYPNSRWLFPSPRKAGTHLVKLNGRHDEICAADPERRRKALHFVLYDLRHSFATRAAASSVPLATLAAILGHASLRMITRYVHPQQSHINEEMARIARPVEAKEMVSKQQVQ